MNTIKRYLLFLLAWLSLIFGTIGIFLPLLPTVPLWLLSAWCFSKSSERWNQWLLNHPQFGPVIKQWSSGQGIPKKTKLRAITCIFVGIGISILIVDKNYLKIMLLTIALCVSCYIYFRLPDAK